ncbi:MAG: hypothetical protein WD355_00640 [Balneolaceae bacterium]
MFRNRLYVILVAFILILLAAIFLLQDLFEVDNVVEMERRYLAVDTSLHAGLENMELVMGQARDPRKIFTQFEDEWEAENRLRYGFFGSVIRDHEGKFRAYYKVGSGEGGVATAVALSLDGIHWYKPKLNIAPKLIDHPKSNLIYIEPHPAMDEGWYGGTHAFYDENAPAESRYKLAWRIGRELYVATSSDGYHFETQGRAVVYKADTNHSYFFDSLRDEYVIYGRVRGNYWDTHREIDRRGVSLHRSDRWDATPWPEETTGQIILDPMDIWDYDRHVKPDLYAPNIQVYHEQYIGLPTTFFRDDRRVPAERPDRITGPIYPIFMHSRDGIDWTFPDKDHSVIELESFKRRSSYPDRSSDEREVGQINAASNLIETDDQLLIYFLHRDDTHYEAVGDEERALYVVFMRKDGFASLRSQNGQTGIWLTPVLTLPDSAAHLRVNANVKGSLKAEVLDASTGEPVDGFTVEESRPFRGDNTAARMSWKTGKMSELANQNIQLRFYLNDGEIYSFNWLLVRQPADQ